MAWHLIKQNSSVGITMGYGLDNRGSNKVRGKTFFSVTHSVKTGSGAHLASDTMGTGDSFY
jgi:hypothetical protein